MTQTDAKSLDQLKQLLAANAVNKALPIQLANQFVDAAARITLRQKMIMSPVVKNCKQMSHFDQHYYDLTLNTNERVIYPGSTTVLGIIAKEWLIRLMQVVGVEEMQKRLDTALDEGSLTHYITALSDNGYAIVFDHPTWQIHDPDLREQAQLTINACKELGIPHFLVTNQDVMEQCLRWEQIIDVIKPETRAIEKIVVSTKYRYAGTLDRIWYIKAGTYPLNGSKMVTIPKDGIALVDIKTGAEDDNYPKQEASYGEAFEESTGENCDYCITAYIDAKQKGEYPGIKLVVAERDEWKHDFEGFMHAHALWWDKNGDKIPQVKKFKSIIYRQTVPIDTGGVVNNKAAQTQFLEKLNAIIGKSLTEDLKAAVAQEEKRPTMPKAKKSPKGIHSPDNNKKTPPAKANAQPEAPKKGDEGFFDAGTTGRYTK